MTVPVRHRAIARLLRANPDVRRRALAGLSDEEQRVLAGHWPGWAHRGQLAPAGEWATWVLMAGRGFGRTRAGAEFVSAFARENAGAAIALVAASLDEARAVMVEGRSGLLAVASAGERREMAWEPSKRRLVFASGAEAFLYSGGNPEGLRGPEHHLAWCDELAKWRHAKATWDNLRLGLRLGERPRALVTTTPRSVGALKALIGRSDAATTGGATRANPFLAEAAVDALVAEHEGTRFGRQELEGVLVEDVEGALWTREMMESSRSGTSTGEMQRVVVGVDPPAGAEGTCGIVVCGQGEDGVGYVLADCTVSGLSPEGWARRAAAAAAAWGAHRVVAEKNNGGAMVEAVLRGADEAVASGDPGPCGGRQVGSGGAGGGAVRARRE